MGQAEDSAAKILQWSESKRTMRVAKEALRLSKGAAHAWECAKSAATDTRVGACRYLVVILLEMKPRVNDRGLSQPTVAYHSS